MMQPDKDCPGRSTLPLEIADCRLSDQNKRSIARITRGEPIQVHDLTGIVRDQATIDTYFSQAASTGKSQLLIFNDLYLLVRNTEPKETGTLLVPLLVASTKIEDKVRLSKLQPPIELMIAAEEMVFGPEYSNQPPRVIEGNRCGVLHLAAKQWDAVLTILENNGIMSPGSRKSTFQSILLQQAKPNEIMQVRLPSNVKIWNRDSSVYVDPNNYPHMLDPELAASITKANGEIKILLGCAL